MSVFDLERIKVVLLEVGEIDKASLYRIFHDIVEAQFYF